MRLDERSLGTDCKFLQIQRHLKKNRCRESCENGSKYVETEWHKIGQVTTEAELLLMVMIQLGRPLLVPWPCHCEVKKLPPLASSRTPGFPSNNDQENAYDDSLRHATTSNGNLWWVPQDGTLRPHADPALPLGLGKRRLGGRHGTDCSEATDFEPGQQA